MRLTQVMKIWDKLHIKNTGDVGYCDLEKAVEEVVGVKNDVDASQPSLKSEAEYSIGNDGQKWPATTDAAVWAEAFQAHKLRNNWSTDDIDEGLMLGWFANAMQAGDFAEAPAV